MTAAPTFPRPWLDLIAARSSLGEAAVETIAAIETRVAEREAEGAVVFPARESRYRALEMVTPENARVCVAGQDPYHGLATLPDGAIVPQSMGLAFSVPRGARMPPSLQNIFKEMAADLGAPRPDHGDLSHWARQGVLLLNTVLTVEKNRPKSHDKLGWQAVTAAVFEALSASRPGLVFILWGNSAKGLKPFIADNGHTVIESSHPSPIGGSCYKGFFGSRPFSRSNAALEAAGKAPVRWADEAA